MTGCFLCHITTPKQCNNTNHTDRNVPNQSRQNSEEATEDENNWNAFNQQLPNSSKTTKGENQPTGMYRNSKDTTNHIY